MILDSSRMSSSIRARTLPVMATAPISLPGTVPGTLSTVGPQQGMNDSLLFVFRAIQSFKRPFQGLQAPRSADEILPLGGGEEEPQCMGERCINKDAQLGS